VNSALTDAFDPIVTEQLPVPVQAPPQPLNEELIAAFAFSVTTVPVGKLDAQFGGHVIPFGELTATPSPLPDCATASVLVAG
jgi:hypothetical protein